MNPKKSYLTELQKFRESSLWERLQARKGSDDNDYTGDLTPMLCPMMQDQSACLKQGKTFPYCDIIALCVAEKANYWGISFQTGKSDKLKMYCCGTELFLVFATNSDMSGWTITRCQVLEEADQHMVGSPHLPPEVSTTIPWSLYKAAMIVPLIAKMIAEMPMLRTRCVVKFLNHMESCTVSWRPSYRGQGWKHGRLFLVTLMRMLDMLTL